jgi:hypothetical protein
MRQLLKIAVVLFLCGTACGQVQIDFFYEPGCQDCERIEAGLLPDIEHHFSNAVVIQRYDIGVESNFLYLLQLEEDLKYTDPKRAYLVIGRQDVFGASPDKGAVFGSISNALHSELSAPMFDGRSSLSLEQRFRGFTESAVIIAGLIDGINPCAISTLVFFMSLLGVAKIRRRRLLLLGISYCLASFLTYLALGFGLFRVLHLFSGFTVLRSAVEWGMAAVLLVLALLSFRDAVRYRRSGRSGDVSLQLSTVMKKRIHGVMRHGLGSTSIFFGGLLIGTAVTALESVCTGQVYVPTLVLILKDSTFSETRAWMLLLLYNILFILPLVIVFIAVYFGLRTEVLLSWSRRNVVSSKLLLGLFFVLMALLIVWR